MLVNSNRSRIKSLIKIKIIKINFPNICLLILERLLLHGAREPPVMKTREEWKKLIDQGWRRTEEDWTKKIELGLLILNKRLNNTQLLTHGDSRSKRFILFKLFLPKSKSINLAFLLTNLL